MFFFFLNQYIGNSLYILNTSLMLEKSVSQAYPITKPQVRALAVEVIVSCYSSNADFGLFFKRWQAGKLFACSECSLSYKFCGQILVNKINNASYWSKMSTNEALQEITPEFLPFQYNTRWTAYLRSSNHFYCVLCRETFLSQTFSPLLSPHTCS